MNLDYDVAVIGAGSGWLTVALWLAWAGKNVVMIEKWLIGGDCTNVGCVPSKALLDISKSWKFDSMQEALTEVRARRQVIQDEETPDKIETKNLKILQWTAKFIDKNTVEVDWNQKISAKNIVIATWASPKIIPIDWLEKKDILTNESVFEQTDNIKNLLVIGGWYIGCELAESFQKLGVKVTLVQRNVDLIPMEEPESRDLIKAEFEKIWMQVMTNSTPKKVENGEMIVENNDSKKTTKIKFDKVLIALWRAANVWSLDLEKAEIDFSKWWITVNKYNQTNQKNIFAIGDCVLNNPQFTHWANNEGRWVVRNIIFSLKKSSNRSAALPACLYTKYEVARVWKTREELLKKFGEDEIITKKIEFSNNDRSKVTNDTEWFVMVHFKRLSGKILWATVAWSHAWELLPVFVTAIDNWTSAYVLSKSVYAYPTKAELIKKVCDQFVVHTLSNIKWEIKYFFTKNKLQFLTAIIWITLIVVFFLYKNTNQLTVEEIAFAWYNFIQDSAWWPIIFGLAYILRPIVFFPGSLMTVMAWALFGFWLGFAYVMVGAWVSASISYFLGKIFWKSIVKWASEWGFVSNLKKQADASPFMTIIMSRLLFFPYDIVNYVAGFLKIDFKSYLLGTLIWIIPWVSVIVFAGSWFYGQELTSFQQALEWANKTVLFSAIAIFIAISLIAKKLQKKSNLS